MVLHRGPGPEPSKAFGKTPISRGTARRSRSRKIDDSTLQPDRDGVSPVVSSELEQDVFDVALYAFLGEMQLPRNLLIRIAAGNQLQYADFARS